MRVGGGLRIGRPNPPALQPPTNPHPPTSFTMKSEYRCFSTAAKPGAVLAYATMPMASSLIATWCCAALASDDDGAPSPPPFSAAASVGGPSRAFAEGGGASVAMACRVGWWRAVD